MKKKKKYTFRKFINDVHLWLGLASGIILFLVCLSGTILTFEDEIKSFTSEELNVEKTATSKKSITELQKILQKEGKVTAVTLIANEEKAYEFRVKTSKEDRRGTTFYINPYTGEYQQHLKSDLDGFFSSMFRLHRWLLLDSKIGRPIVGIATLIFLVISVTGLVLWFPKKTKWKNFKPGFKIKFSANWKRINHDLHNTLGFYACIFIVIMALTGLCWSFEWYRDFGTKVLGAQIFGGRNQPAIVSQAQGEMITIDDALKVIDKEFPYEGDVSINFLQEGTDVYKVRKYSSERFSPIISDNITIDRDGKILDKEIFSEKPINQQIVSLIKPLHMGYIYGSFSKTIYFLACLIATSLPVTGTIIWINKMKKKNKKRG
ncbi:PepSY domain-containing protein [Mesonia sp. K7]|uniref:PepSY-associated TM helix domain-containing protein n=1 Tax=Mesonia sp. K7 TaxID=2218606 RepID=UPI000DA9D54A|nr:PepSY-associated TM helix domain-containing protein [Mesonia sp. K7]PZD78509.1 PepSY domain-containing protein [Mesonia sp. K7]